MAKTKISEFSATPANNTDIDSINIAEGCAPSGINDAIRELMAQLKDFQTGAVGDSFNGPVGTSTAAAGAFTTLAASGSVTLSGGTANGVTYLNGSKVLTSGSALQFDGTSLFVGATSAAAGKLVVKDTASSNTLWLVGRTSDGASSVSFRNAADSAYTGRIELDPSVGMLVGTTGATTQLTLANAGNLGLGVTPSAWGSNYRAMEFGDSDNQSFFSGQTNANVVLMGTNTFHDNTNYKYKFNGYASFYLQFNGEHRWSIAPSGTAGATATFTQAMTLDASGNLAVGTTTPQITGSGRGNITLNGSSSAIINLSVGDVNKAQFYHGGTDMFIGNQANGYLMFQTNATERARIDSSGNFLFSKTASDVTVAGTQIESTGTVGIVRNAAVCLIVNRLTDDGTLVSLRQASTEEGTISVSGTTVSYNGGHLSRWAQMLTKPELFKGTVMSNLDEMNVYTKDGQPVANEQLNKVKVSDTEGDANVAGVFVNWSHDEDHNVDEINMAMTGDMIIRIAQGVTVVRGDLLMSAGDGTAKPQGDDIVRSKTVAKVTSNHITCTYADGSYCVPCVLMAC